MLAFPLLYSWLGKGLQRSWAMRMLTGEQWKFHKTLAFFSYHCQFRDKYFVEIPFHILFISMNANLQEKHLQGYLIKLKR